MHLHPRDIPQMEALLAEKGISVDVLCDRAEIDRATWWRWREEKASPRLNVWERAVATFDDLVADRVPGNAAVTGGNLREAS